MKNTPVLFPSKIRKLNEMLFFKAREAKKNTIEDWDWLEVRKNYHGKNITIADLLDRGVNVNIKDSDGMTALKRATSGDNTEAAWQIIRGAVVTPNNNGAGYKKFIGNKENCETIISFLENIHHSNLDTEQRNTLIVLSAILPNGDLQKEVMGALIDRDFADYSDDIDFADKCEMLISGWYSWCEDEVAGFYGENEIELILKLKKLKTELSSIGLTEDQQNSAIAGKMGMADNMRNVSTYLAAILPDGELRDKIIQKFNSKNPNHHLNLETINALRCFAYGVTDRNSGKEVVSSKFTKIIHDNNGDEKEVIDYQRAGHVIWELASKRKLLMQLTCTAENLIQKVDNSTNSRDVVDKVLYNPLLLEKINSYLPENNGSRNLKVLDIFVSYLKSQKSNQNNNEAVSSSNNQDSPNSKTTATATKRLSEKSHKEITNSAMTY